jgi:hypothetical protein
VVELVKQLQQQQLYYLQVITATKTPLILTTKITTVEITEEIIDGMARTTIVMEMETIIGIEVTTSIGEMVKDGRPAQQQQQQQQQQRQQQIPAEGVIGETIMAMIIGGTGITTWEEIMGKYIMCYCKLFIYFTF